VRTRSGKESRQVIFKKGQDQSELVRRAKDASHREETGMPTAEDVHTYRLAKGTDTRKVFDLVNQPISGDLMKRAKR
jgi:hypothetical protein